jgi:hypothetical protein
MTKITTFTDFEICKRIAEIEGLDLAVGVYKGDGTFLGLVKDSSRLADIIQYNPIRDWSTIGPLISKHEIDMNHFNCPKKGPQWLPFFEDTSLDDTSSDSEIKKSACLAIIQKHKDNK